MQQLSRQIAGAQDFELGLPRTSQVTYHCAFPDSRANGLVFVIPGFGEDAGADYNQLLRRYICGRYNLAVVTVAYHCSQSRPPEARFELKLEDMQRVLGFLSTRNIHLKLDLNDVASFVRAVQNTGLPITITTRLVPPNGDYQNFGVMQAIDHICVLNDILDSGADFDADNIICFGSSHGAYIAHLLHKFAPNTINGIIDISSYAIPIPRYLGCSPEFLNEDGNLTLACNVQTRWTFGDSYAADYFGPARYAIRDVRSPAHIARIAAQADRKCQFRMMNSTTDALSRPEVKQAQARTLRAHGFDVQLKIIGEGDLDGKIFKSLEHGMNASMSGVFDSYVGSIAVRPTKLDRARGSSLDYECYDQVYRIRHTNSAPYIEASCEPIEQLHS